MTTDVESRVRQELERMSREVVTDPVLPPPVRRGVRRRLAASLVAGVTAAGVLVAASAVGVRWLGHRGAQPAVVPPCSWSAVPSPDEDPSRFDTYLRAVTASGPDDAWAVGIYREPGEGSPDHLELQHWDGSRWATAPAPPVVGHGEGPSVFGTAATGPDDTWAVGLQNTEQGGVPLALHWDGRAWSVSQMPDTGEPESHLFGVTAVSQDDAWAVGGWARPGELRGGGLIMHWDGSRWTSDVLPTTPHPASESGGPYDLLNGVAATSGSDVWAVGQAADVPESESRTLVVHWDGTRWDMVASPNVPPEAGTGEVDNSLQAVATVAADDAWAVGSFQEKGTRLVKPSTDRPLAMHWDGAGWDIVPLPDVGQGGLNGAAAAGTNDVWAVGQTVVNPGGDYDVAPLLLHWDGTAWSQIPAPVEGDAALSAVTAVPGGGFWAVGTQGPGAPGRSLVLRCS